MMKKTAKISGVALLVLLSFLIATPTMAGDEKEFPIFHSKNELEGFIKNHIENINGRVGVYIKHLESNQVISFREDETFQLASVFKIPVLITLFKQIYDGKLSPDDRIILTERMKTYGSGLLSSMKPGLNLTIHDLALLMMAISDNTATDILFQIVGQESIMNYMKELGLKNTTIDYDTRALILDYLGLDPSNRLTIAELNHLPESFWTEKARLERQKAFEKSNHNTSTPKEIALLLEKCIKGEIINKEISEEILGIMKHHTGAELILRYLPMSTEIARKGGSLAKNGENTVLNDAGVIWLPSNAGTMIICMFGNDLREIHYELKDKLGRIARAAYDYFVNLRRK
jgi:beta-lactamase class A